MGRLDVIMVGLEVEAACSCLLEKQDDPPIEAVIQRTIPLVRDAWAPAIDAGIRDGVARLQEADRAGLFDLPPGPRKDGILEEVYLAALLAFVRGGDAAAAQITGGFVRDGARRALSHGYGQVVRDLRRDGRFPRGLQLDNPAHRAELDAAEADLRWWVSKRVARRQSRVRALLVQWETDPGVRKGAGLRAWVEGLQHLLGDPRDFTARAEADTWGYRARNRGQVLALEDQSIGTAVYWNPNDVRTTRFCRWLTGPRRRVRTEVLRAWIRRYERVKAGLSGELEPETPEVPSLQVYWLANPDVPDVRQWKRDLDRGRIGLPPFHGFCRSQLKPR